MIHLEVAVAVPIHQTLTYFPPKDTLELETSDLSEELFLGRRVLVALGKRLVTGYIVGSKQKENEPSEFTIRHVVKFLDNHALFQPNIIALFRWVAEYYHYPVGMVIKAALPGGLAPKSQKLLSLRDQERVKSVIAEKKSPDWLLQLMQAGTVRYDSISRDFTKEDKTLLKKLKNLNCIEEQIHVAKDAVREKTEPCISLVDSSLPAPEVSEDVFENVAAYQLRLSDYFARKIKLSEAKALCVFYSLFRPGECEFVALKEIRKIYPGATKAIETLIEKDRVLRKENRRVYRNPFGEQLRYYARPDSLTTQQQEVMAELTPAIEQRSFTPFLLHGITGCGKTEVYLRAAELTLQLGRDVIILVPEIALATQLEAHLVSRFKDDVVLLHSGLSSSEKFDQYFLALSGRARIVIGARSAVFAPLKDPGLIIVDEEHDTSYKQDDSFRYHGRDLAVVRGRHHGSVVLLGSATPSITSYNNVKKGKYRLLEMDARVGNSCLPTVQLIDLSQRRQKGQQIGSIIGSQLLGKLQITLESKKQAVLLHNRRGFSNALLCKDCGTPVQCNHCNVSLTLHKGKNQLICHYCGYTTGAAVVCVNCRSTKLAPVGFGTERVEEELQSLLPDARIQRIDSDTAADRKRFTSILKGMHEGEIDILIGTQMIAKGHHFPNVTLVGVVWADGGMSMPDYKAAERTYQLITQVTGRAGRGEFPGEVIIQTLRPDHYAIQFAKNHQYTEFYNHEMVLRQHPAFPPYVRLGLLQVKGKVENHVQQSALRFARFCRKAVAEKKCNVEVLGPAPAPLDKVKDNFRWQVLLKASVTTEIHELCKAIQVTQKELLVSQCTISIDIDPENMM